MDEIKDKPRILFWPLGNPSLESSQEDARRALENLKETGFNFTTIDKMTWWEPSEISKLARSIRMNDFDLIVVFSATHGTVRCIAKIGRLYRKTPFFIWSIPIRYSLATSAIAARYLRDIGIYVKLTNRKPEDRSIHSEVSPLARSAHAQRLSNSLRIGLLGNISPLMITLPHDLRLLQTRLGPKTSRVTMAELEHELDKVNQKKIGEKLSDYRKRYDIKVKDEILKNAIRFQLAVSRIIKKRKLDGIAMECWTNLFAKYKVNPCLGHLDDLSVGCEGDVASLSGSLILKEMNGVKPYLADILSVDQDRGTIELSHCSAPISLAADQSKVTIGERTDPKSSGKTAFANFELRKGPVTLVRFYGREFEKIHLTCGELENTGNYWGGISLVIKSKGDVRKFLNNVSGNHYLVTWGDVRPELRYFAEWRGIEIVED